MSHKCGAGCHGKQDSNSSTRKDCPNHGSAAARRTLIADGRRRELSAHAIAKMRSENMTKRQIRSVIENWQVRAVDVRIPNDPRPLYWRVIPVIERAIRVVTSFDGSRIITATLDRNATGNIRKKNRAYFERPDRRDVEVRFDED